jgi:hypothetical protein
MKPSWTVVVALAVALGCGCSLDSRVSLGRVFYTLDSARITANHGVTEVSLDGKAWTKVGVGSAVELGTWLRSGEHGGGDLAIANGQLYVRFGPNAVLHLDKKQDSRAGTSDLSIRLGLRQGRILCETRGEDMRLDLWVLTASSTCRNVDDSPETRWESKANGDIRVLDGTVVVVPATEFERWVVRQGEELSFLEDPPSRQLTNCPATTLAPLRAEFADMSKRRNGH